jgi:DNA-directed RNA polymerase subunit RPC12/RpoP
MPLSNFILNLPGFAIKKIHDFNPIIIEVNYRPKSQCPHCGNKRLRKKHGYVRKENNEGQVRNFKQILCLRLAKMLAVSIQPKILNTISGIS